MIDIINLIGSLGVGAFLGLVIFLMYRQDRRASEKRLSLLLEQDQTTRREHTEAVVEYTKVLTELTTLLVRMNGRFR